MSGPITAGFVLVHGLLLLSARAIEEARAMKGEFDTVRADLARRDREQSQARNRQQQARLERIASLRRRADQQQSRLFRLRSLADTLCGAQPELAASIPTTMPVAPIANDDAAWSAYVSELDAAMRALEGVIAKLSGGSADAARASIETRRAVPSIDEVLRAYTLQRTLRPGLDAAKAEEFRAAAARILGRLELPADASLPTELEALAREIVLAASVEHAEALASELRRAVQRQREAWAAQRVERDEARALLEQLPEAAPASLVLELEAVAAGAARLDASLKAAARDVLADKAAEEERIEEEAAALVLEESLRDLGYEVEGIEATLFARGGTAHFRRSGWENYFVRLRVDPHERTVNFNVVRARGDEETAERRRLDTLAEDRWCAEFPKLMQTLAARGLKLDVTRRLEAGEIPVQVVDAQLLPGVHEDTAGRADQPLRRRELS
jgi:hypothetical protein